MINFNNHKITGMSYNNHTIKKAYGCDGHLVWSGDTQEYMLTYKCLGDDVKIPYNSSFTINQGYASCRTYYGVATRITDVVIGNKTKTIGGCAFCDGLLDGQSVMIPSSVKRIGMAAFTGNSGMTLTFSAPMPPSADTSAFTAGNGCKYIVPCKALSRYKTLWSEVGNYITAATTSCTQLPVYDGVTYDFIMPADEDSYITLNYSIGNVDRIDIEINSNGGHDAGSKSESLIQTNNWFFNLYQPGSAYYPTGHLGSNNGSVNYNSINLIPIVPNQSDRMIVRSSTLSNPETIQSGALTLYTSNYGGRRIDYYSTYFLPRSSGYITLFKGAKSLYSQVYSVKMYYNDTLKANYVPATLTGIAGMYDTINNKFSLPNGTMRVGGT